MLPLVLALFVFAGADTVVVALWHVSGTRGRTQHHFRNCGVFLSCSATELWPKLPLSLFGRFQLALCCCCCSRWVQRVWQVIAVPAVANVVALIDDIELSHSSSLLLCCVKCIVAFDTNVARDVVVYVCACVLARVLALINSAGCCNMLSSGLLLFLKYDCYGVVVVNVASNFVATCVRCFVVVSKEKNYTRRNGCSCCF